jgi:hypothetical protein
MRLLGDLKSGVATVLQSVLIWLVALMPVRTDTHHRWRFPDVLKHYCFFSPNQNSWAAVEFVSANRAQT